MTDDLFGDGYTQDGEHTVGWSGEGGTSRRAEPGRRGRYGSVVRFVRERGERGATWTEVAKRFDLHHGQATGPLSVAHKDGDLTRLREERRGCGVYVAPEFVNGRETVPHGRNSVEQRIRDAYREGQRLGYLAGYEQGMRDGSGWGDAYQTGGAGA